MTTTPGPPECPLCQPVGEEQIWRDAGCRVILAGDPEYPGLCRVVWHDHVKELTDLGAEDRTRLLSVVLAVELALRQLLLPDKVNLASLGNQVPHLHWHVIPRFSDDAHFPDSVWGPRRRRGARHQLDPRALRTQLATLLGPGLS